MNVQEMIKRSRENAKKRTPEQRRAFLQRANILDANGCYKAEFFSEETVAASKARNAQTVVNGYVHK
ncbi:hypothetical protein ACFODO_12475 [Acinetobacter sichuanensis]|jgi:hypothetical protein|uniref:Uncharacterized protein n=1 Tax=Acinetobacter sichuanensis TaxID=2136183 RepID=A0A371YJQ6_9GAMM|nr:MULTISPECIES: hypothetical protein [Acinetobacter]MCE6009338.1 hypothetical protein [Acinetobacter soli]RFC81692.1 hypothetical protein C9E89_020480 [Acinetobacter sichuanensis]RFS24429.1 hypothetical protein DYI81_17045 [Acinetobacter sp. SWAC5]UIP95266.1 hypothetical protein LXM48_00185 [Acinetobacter johnsonii]HRM15984.1 hypothetical protein [Acinetobacter parvus]